MLQLRLPGQKALVSKIVEKPFVKFVTDPQSIGKCLLDFNSDANIKKHLRVNWQRLTRFDTLWTSKSIEMI